MRQLWVIFAATVLILCGCGVGNDDNETKSGKEPVYMQITAEEAKSRMDEREDVLILDVREMSEYNEGHVPGAVLLPVGTITEETAANVIENKETLVLVYCRSGNRSKTAAQALAELGYNRIYEFGGIRDWPYEVEK